MKKVSILDYGMGNIASLKNAIEKIGFEVDLLSNVKSINSNILIIPGVGAYNAAMEKIKRKNYDKIITNFLKNKDNCLFGICLGMQILLTLGEENKLTHGLDLIKGRVSKFETKKNIKFPNVGTSKIHIKNSGKFDFLRKYDNEKFYFVHSYIAKPSDSKNILATSKYEDISFNSIISNNLNVLGTQFHPEKSSKIGLDFLQDIIKNLN